MPENLKKLRIFAASPSDVASERAKLETVVDSLKPMADYLGLTLEVVDWRAVVPDAGRPQQIIFDQLKPTSWDIFIGILWHRFGTPPGAKDKTGKDYLSGTEEEFKTAYELWKQHGKPRMVLYRCTRALPFDVDPNHLKKVRKFFKLVENVKGDYPTLYQAFDTTESFEKLALNNLQKLLVEYGEETKRPITPEVEQVLAPKIPNNLPRKQAFFGRSNEMDKVMRALGPDDRTWGILVDGIGGIGKSAIAVEAAYRAQEVGLFEAFVFVTAKQNILEPSGIKELNPPAKTLDEFLNETARVLGQPGIAKLTGNEKRRALIDVLRSTRTLLVYDNLETLTKEEQEGIADFLREVPQGCKAIITSRRRGGEGGIWLRVEKLDWEAAHGIIENQISLDRVLANKLNRVGRSRWQELFDETNGSPLALVHTLGLMRVRVALTFERALEMLRGNRDQDLQKFIFQEAHKELTENDKAALGALSFFESSAVFEAWMEVANLSRNALETSIDRLTALSLVDVLAGEERYNLHPLTRAFVRNEFLYDAKIARETGLRFARYWVGFAQIYGGDTENYKTFNRLDVEWMNLEATAKWLWNTTNAQRKIIRNKNIAQMLNDLVNALNQPLWFIGRWDEYLQLGAYMYQISCKLRAWTIAGTFASNLATIHFARSRKDDAILWLNHGVEAFAHGDSDFDQIMLVIMKGNIQEQYKNYAKATQLYKKALISMRNVGLAQGVQMVLAYLGRIAYKQKDYEVAKDNYSEALKMAEKLDDKETRSLYSEGLGDIALDRKRLSEAKKWFEQELALAKEIGRQELIAGAQYGLARVYKSQRRIDLALPLAQEAMKIYERLQHKNLAEIKEFVEELKKSER